MKYHFNIIIILLIFFSQCLLHAEERWVKSDSNFIWEFQGIDCADAMNCITVAQDQSGYGAFIRSTADGGNTWKYVFVDTIDLPNRYFPNPLYSVSYPDKELCLVCCDSGVIMRTTNQGDDWQVINIGKNKVGTARMYDKYFGAMFVRFHNEDGFELYKTYDGGETWIEIEMPQDYKWITPYDFNVPGKDIIIALTLSEDGREIIISTDGGDNWVKRQAADVSSAMCFISETEGWAASYKGDGPSTYDKRQIVYHTTDAGVNWKLQRDTNVNAGRIQDIKFFDKLNGIIISGYCKIFWTHDGGKTWIENLVGPQGENDPVPFLRKVAYPVSDAAFLIGTYGVVYKYENIPDGIEENYAEDIKIKIYPNPINKDGILNLNLSLKQGANIEIELINMPGGSYKLYKGPQAAGNKDYRFNINELYEQSGLYMLRFNIGAKVVYRKVIKM